MKRFFAHINKQLLITKPILWITAIPWVLGACLLIGVIQVVIGIVFPLSYNFSLIAYFIYLLVASVCFMVGAFQFRNFESEFSFKQTYYIYLLNIITYLIFAFCVLMLSLTLHFRFKLTEDKEDFGKKLLAVRIGSLSDSDIVFIRTHPQLYTSLGSSTYGDTSRGIDLTAEYDSRMKLEKIPFSKSDLSSKYPIILALREEKGFETVDSLLTARENAPVPRSMSMERYANGGNPTELDPDPIFYKYLSGLSEQQIDSIRDVKQKVLTEYYIRETETERFRNYAELKQKFDSLIFNTSLPAIDEIGLLILVIVLVSTLVFILVVTKSVATLMAIAITIAIASTTGYLMSYSFEIGGVEYIFGSSASLLFFIIAYFLIYKRKKTTKIFIFHCINAATISLILTILGTFSSTTGTISAMVVAILITEFFFIRKMYHKMSFG